MSTVAAPDRSRGLISVEQALDFMLDRARPVGGIETVDVGAALGRVLARPQISPIDVPSYANSSMDGYAVRSDDVQHAGRRRLPVVQRIAAGGGGARLEPGEAARIFTGAPLPEGADAVVIQEVCEREADFVGLRGPVAAGENVRPRANDIRCGAEVLARGTRIRPQEMGLAASVGLSTLPVFRRLRVAIFASGDELVAPGEVLAPGTIYNSNRYTLLGLLAGLGCQAFDFGVVTDTFDATQAALEAAAREADLVVTSGGMSEGEEDHVKNALEAAGRLELWKVAVKPGKPLAYGRIGEADFIGLPGNPVSTLVGFCLFVRPFILKRQGASEVCPDAWRVSAGFAWPRPGDRREFVRVRLISDGPGTYRAEIYPKQGSDVLTSTVWADGLVDIPQGTAIRPGDPVSYLSFAELLG